MDDSDVSRRTVLRATAGATVAGTAALAGCASDDGTCTVEDADASVATGPGGANVFEPETVTVAVGDTVGWCFESAGHNVSAVPDHSDEVAIPEGAEPFATYDGDARFETVGTGETYTHTFETAGEYTYVCVPHVAQGMIGTVVVE